MKDYNAGRLAICYSFHFPDRIQIERMDPRDRHGSSPAKLLLIVIMSTMIAEIGVMLLFDQLPTLPPLLTSIADGLLLAVLIVPVLYVFMFRPLKLHIEAMESAETLLLGQRDKLEEIVRDRTSDLLESERKLTEAQRISHIGNWELILPSGQMFWSEEMTRIMGLPGKEPHSLERFVESADAEDRPELLRRIGLAGMNGKPFSLEFRIHPGGETRFVHMRAEAGPAAEPKRLFGTLQDVTDRKEAEEKIHYLAYFDPLTGLPNRTLIRDRIATSIAAAGRKTGNFAILALNIDGLKLINDSFGLSVGDEILKHFAERLEKHIRGEDSIARLSGDEFLLLLQDTEASGAGYTARRILSGMQESFPIGAQQIIVTCCIGIAIFPDHGEDADTLIKNANAAMYFAKSASRGTFRFFTHEMNALSAERLLLENELRSAIKSEQLILHYQPQMDLDSGRLIGFEALVRWAHPVRDMIPPDQFIPIAEESGLIGKLGELVLRKACFQAIEWQKEGLEIVPIAVNVSSAQFRQKEFIESVETALLDSGLDLAFLELELTESLLLSNADLVLEVLGRLKEMGVRLLIDDFGTGYSSLSYLKRLPVYKLKIDKSFVQGLPWNQDDAAIVNAIIGIARSLKMKVIAEGVETLEQFDFLKGKGCNEIQGYYFGRPMPADAAKKLLSLAE